jgi:hypothetical protein
VTLPRPPPERVALWRTNPHLSKVLPPPSPKPGSPEWQQLIDAVKREEGELFEQELAACRRRRAEEDEFAELLGPSGDPWAH